MDAQKYRRSILLFLGASLALHVLAIVGLYFVRSSPPVSPPPAVFVDLNSLPPDAFSQMAQEKKDTPKQIVESEQADNAATPEDAKYLGERNQVAEKQTKAREVDIFRKGGAASQAGNNGKNLSLKDLAPGKTFTPPTKLEAEGFKREQQLSREAGGRPGQQALDNAGSANNDYLKDVAEGDRTLLSTKEFVYFGYYRRIRQQLEVAWNSKLRAVMMSYYAPGGRQLAGDRDYVTGVIVVLDRNGTITSVQLMQKSGARDLDQAAVDAFNDAGPFPDPPTGIVDENGEIRIPWNFILQS